MLTPIDYGKNFLQTLYNERNADGAAGYLADDLVWVTPDEIRHLKSREDILAFLRLSVQDDPELYNVDIASIKSAPGDGESTDKYGRATKVVNTMIQTDAAINSGNSGGGMFNTAGQLVGIPTLKYIGTRYSSNATVESIGMCIPINEAKDVISEALKADKQAVGATEEKKEESGEETGGDLKGKPRMGVSVQTVRDTKGMLPRGVYVAEVEKNSPAEAAGVQVGDIMVEINGQVITSVEEEIEILGKLKEGDEVKLKVFRPETVNETGGVSSEGDYVDLTVKLAIVDAVAQ